MQRLTYSSLYLQQKDCYKGVVFDGLESLFASSLESSLLCVLRAAKNCHHIYVVNLHQDYASWKAKDNLKERGRKLKERRKVRYLFSNLLSQPYLKPSTLSLCIWVCSRACKKWFC